MAKWRIFGTFSGRRALAAATTCLALSYGSALAAPGDILFEDDFDATAVTCGALAPNWATTDANLAGVDTFTFNSAPCSLFTRGGAVSVTSVVIDTSIVSGANLTAWVQKGADTFSEDPDGAGESLVLEYLDQSGFFVELQEFNSATLADGAITLVNIDLPFGALHSGFQLRFRQLGGSGGPPANGGLGFDFWHVDDVVLTETGIAPPPPPPSTLTANSCDDFENGLANWIVSNPTTGGIGPETFQSPSNSLFLRHSATSVTSVAVPAPGLEQITMTIQRGDDSFSENPDAGEDLVVEYLNASGVFVPLETLPGAGPPGEILPRTFTAPADARHGGFQLRFNYLGGSGPDFDYWHVDDVCLVSELPNLVVTKTVELEADPIGVTPAPFGVPGAFALYTIEVTNQSGGIVDAGTLSLSDVIDENTLLFVGDLDGTGVPFRFVDGLGPEASGVSLVFNTLGDGGDGVTFRNSAGTEIVPVPDFDPDTRSFDLVFTGAMNGASGGSEPTFQVQYRVRLQ
ncbi:MAG: hypothetical protein AAGK23_02960 [Pseudomonadota bacterium]